MAYVLLGFFGLMFVGGLTGISVAAYRSQQAALSRGRLDVGVAQIRRREAGAFETRPVAVRSFNSSITSGGYSGAAARPVCSKLSTPLSNPRRISSGRCA